MPTNIAIYVLEPKVPTTSNIYTVSFGPYMGMYDISDNNASKKKKKKNNDHAKSSLLRQSYGPKKKKKKKKKNRPFTVMCKVVLS